MKPIVFAAVKPALQKLNKEIKQALFAIKKGFQKHFKKQSFAKKISFAGSAFIYSSVKLVNKA